MRLSLAILSTLALSVLANKHRLCCCTGRNRRDTETICRSDLSQKVVDEGGERYVKSFRPWNKKDNPEMPLKGAWDQEPGMGYVCYCPLPFPFYRFFMPPKFRFFSMLVCLSVCFLEEKWISHSVLHLVFYEAWLTSVS